MRGLLFAMGGFGLACAIGALLLGAPSLVAEIFPAEAGEPALHSGCGVGWIVAMCWLTLLLSRPRWLATTLTLAVLITGTCAVALGAASEFWSHATASPEASGKAMLGGGVLILLAPVAGLLRARRK